MMRGALVEINVLAGDIDNAVEIMSVSDGRAYVGVTLNRFSTVDAAVAEVAAMQAAGVRVSVGLGAGDATQWRRALDTAVRTHPAHLNQVFPAAGLSSEVLRARGHSTIVNALIAPSGVPGRVLIGTGPLSSRYHDTVSCEFAAAVLAELGIPSLKFYSVDGIGRLDELAVMVRAAVEQGIEIFEPTGGIDLENVSAIVRTCIDNGARHVVPHVYTSIIDSRTGATRVADVGRLIEEL